MSGTFGEEDWVYVANFPETEPPLSRRDYLIGCALIGLLGRSAMGDCVGEAIKIADKVIERIDGGDSGGIEKIPTRSEEK